MRFAKIALAVLTEYLPATFLGMATLVVTVDVIGRYGFNHPFIGVSEIALISMLWIVYLGSISVMQRSEHIALELFVHRFGSRGRAIMDTIVYTVMSLTTGILLYLGVKFVTTTAFSSLVVSGLSRRVLAAAIPIMAGFIFIMVLIRLVKAVRGIITADYVRPQDSSTDQPEPVVAGGPTI